MHKSLGSIPRTGKEGREGEREKGRERGRKEGRKEKELVSITGSFFLHKRPNS
jgi:hypothetical protein